MGDAQVSDLGEFRRRKIEKQQLSHPSRGVHISPDPQPVISAVMGALSDQEVHEIGVEMGHVKPTTGRLSLVLNYDQLRSTIAKDPATHALFYEHLKDK